MRGSFVNYMNEISRANNIISRRARYYPLMVDGEKSSLSTCSACPYYPHGGRRSSEPGYRKRTSSFPPDRSVVAAEVFISSPYWARKRCAASRPKPAHTTAENQRHYRSHASHNTRTRHTLEHTRHGQGAKCQQGHGLPCVETAQPQAAFGQDIQAEQRQALHGEVAGCCRPVSKSSEQGSGPMCRREEPDPSPRPDTATIAIAARYPGAADTRLHTTRNDNFIRGAKHARRQGNRGLYGPASAPGVHPIPADHRRKNPAGSGPASYRRQLRHTQTSARFEVAQASSPVPPALYTDFEFMAKHGGTMVPGNNRQAYPTRLFRKRPGLDSCNYGLS